MCWTYATHTRQIRHRRLMLIQEGDGQPHVRARERAYPYGSAGARGQSLQGPPRQAHREGVFAVFLHVWIDAEVSRFHKMKPASQGLDDGLLDGPEQSASALHISSRQPHDIFQFLYIEDSLQGVVAAEFVGACHVDADIRFIPTEGGPDRPSTFAEGDGWPRILPQQETGLAKRVLDQPNWRSRCAGRKVTFPARTVQRHQVLPKDRDQVMPGVFWVRPIHHGSFAITRQEGIEDRSVPMNGTHGTDSNFVRILCHSHSCLT